MTPTKITDSHLDDYTGVFENLDPSSVYLTGETDHDYNCVPWSMGLTDQWIDIENLTDTVAIYKARGFVQTETDADEATIHLLGESTYQLIHAFVKYAGPRVDGMPKDLWESKMTEGERITHNRNGLVGARFGTILASFKRAEIEAVPEIGVRKPIGQRTPVTQKKKRGRRSKR